MSTSKVKYVGNSDIRELGAHDLTKAGVEGFKKTSFEHGVITEVDENVAKALTSHELFAGEFKEVEEGEESSPRAKAETDSSTTQKTAARSSR